MTNKNLGRGNANGPWKFIIMVFSILLIFSGFVFFINGTSAAKLSGGNANNQQQSYNIIIQRDKQLVSEDGVWQKADKSALALKGLQASNNSVKPDAYHLVELNKALLSTILSHAPMQNSGIAIRDAQVLTLPMPDGSFAHFNVLESPIMEPGLAAQYPEIKTYAGYGIEDPTAYVRLDITSFGFHGMILSPNGTVMINPYDTNNTDFYMSYYRRDVTSLKSAMKCLVKGNDIDVSKIDPDTNNSAIGQSLAGHQTQLFNVSSGPTLRTYRLALSATAEFTAFYGGTVSGAMNGIVTIMNRVNGVYNQEVGIQMNLVANDNLLIFTNTATDGFSNNDGGTLLGQNQSKVDSLIGSANYDIGHVFSTGGGGIAGLGVVCFSGQKAQGVTGLPTPIGDDFAIDFVAHEMGHQFGGNHTFNGTTSNCGGGNRNGSTAYEVGSGSTIMAYAGICGSEDLQPHSDPYFHAKSFDEIVTFITNSATCAVQTATNNGTPTVDAGANFTIPKSTPFTLTAASASDPNGDALTYCWEEFDLGTSSPPNTDNGNRPIFRSFNPTTSTSRTFPQISDILNNVSTFGESLPTTSRTMTFRLTVRDNKAVGGGVANDTMQVTSVSAAGPFVITAPGTASWTGGTSQTVTWNVAGTTANGINTANVKISLSTDGGNTFPTVLAASTPNDGSEAITVPNVSTTTARVKVEAVGNIFFDISNNNFTITPGVACTYSLTPTSASLASTASTGNTFTVNASSSSCTSTAVSNDAFITITGGASLTGTGTVTYSVTANTGTSSRTGTITAAGQTFTVTQAGTTACTFSLTPTSASLASTASTGNTFTVNASSSSCTSTAVSNDAFITITGGASLTGTGTVTYSVTANTGTSSRTGTITAAGQTFTVTQAGVSCTYSLSPTSASLSSSASTGNTFTVNASSSSCTSTAVSNDAFITITGGASLTGTGTVTYSVTANTGTSSRTGTITAAGQTFTVTQAGATGCSFTISPTSVSVARTATTGTITVTASSSSCTRTAVSNNAFIQILSGASGTGSGSVTYRVLGNNGAPRTGTITVGGQTFTVNQAGTGTSCSYTLSPGSASLASTASTGNTFTVNASSSSCTSTAVSNSAFITITGGASLTGTGTVTYSVTANTGTSSRTGTITAAGQTFTVTQAGTGGGGGCTFTLSPTSVSVSGAPGVNSTINVTASSSSCSRTAVSNDAFITIVSGATGTGSGTVTYRVLGNKTGSPRTGTITIGGQTFTVNQAAQ